MAEKKRSGNPNKPRKKEDEETNTFLKVVFITGLVIVVFMIAFCIYAISDARKGIRRTEERTELKIEIKKSKIPEIKKQYKEMCDFYLDTASVTVVEQKEYLLETFNKYLELDELTLEYEQWRDRKEFLSDFVFDRVEEEKALKIKVELIRRWKLIIKIQEILKSKLEEAGCESKDYLAHFVDGRFGQKSRQLAETILKSTPSGYHWYVNSSFYMDLEDIFESSKSRLSSVFKFLKKGKLKVIAIELSKSTRDYISTLQKEIEKYQVTAKNKENKEGELIKQKIKQAMDFINLQKKELLQSSRSEEERIEKGRALMLIAVNYVVESWEGFPASDRRGWARYPYDRRGESDRNYEKIDCSTYIKRIVETLFPELNKRYSCIAQGNPWQQSELYAKFLGIGVHKEKRTEIDKFNKIFMIDGSTSRHMKLIFADLNDDADSAVIKISEASGGSVINRIMVMKDEDEDTLEEIVNVSSAPAIKKWLSNN